MAEVLTELVRSAGWAQGVVFVNGHGGNAVAMARAADTLVRESRRLLVWWPSVPGGDPHAGHVETSLMLALAPDEVRGDVAVDTRYRLDRSVMRFGRVIIGGSPLKLFRVSAAGAAVVDRIAAGMSVGHSALVTALVEAGANPPGPPHP